MFQMETHCPGRHSFILYKITGTNVGGILEGIYPAQTFILIKSSSLYLPVVLVDHYGYRTGSLVLEKIVID